ncbi:MAG: hypothetical protein ABMA64_29655, partial [Myxococcota bacterium]
MLAAGVLLPVVGVGALTVAGLSRRIAMLEARLDVMEAVRSGALPASKRAEPTRAEPTSAEPSQADPTRVEPTRAEPEARPEDPVD